MITGLSVVTLPVRDQDEALKFYTEKLGFEKRDDNSTLVPGFRWLTITPKGQEAPLINLFKAEGDLAEEIGHLRTWMFSTDDCQKTYETLVERGVKFKETPQTRPYGVEAMFEDLYGNTFGLIEMRM